MDNKIVLQISITKDDQIEVAVNVKEMDPITLVGLMEQTKLDIFREHMPMVKEVISKIPSKNYDA